MNDYLSPVPYGRLQSSGPPIVRKERLYRGWAWPNPWTKYGGVTYHGYMHDIYMYYSMHRYTPGTGLNLVLGILLRRGSTEYRGDFSQLLLW